MVAVMESSFVKSPIHTQTSPEIVTDEVPKVKRARLSNGYFEGDFKMPRSIDWYSLVGNNASLMEDSDREAFVHFMMGYPMKDGKMIVPADDLTAFLHCANLFGIDTNCRGAYEKFVYTFRIVFSQIVDRFPQANIYGNWSQSIDQLASELELIVRQSSF